MGDKTLEVDLGKDERDRAMAIFAFRERKVRIEDAYCGILEGKNLGLPGFFNGLISFYSLQPQVGSVGIYRCVDIMKMTLLEVKEGDEWKLEEMRKV